eukprot:403374749
MENSVVDSKCENGKLTLFTNTLLATTPSESRGSFPAQEPRNDPPLQDAGQVPLGLGGDEVTIDTSVNQGGAGSRVVTDIAMVDQGVSGQNEMIGEVLGAGAKQDLERQTPADQVLNHKSSQMQPIGLKYDKMEEYKEKNKEKVAKDTHVKFKMNGPCDQRKQKADDVKNKKSKSSQSRSKLNKMLEETLQKMTDQQSQFQEMIDLQSKRMAEKLESQDQFSKTFIERLDKFQERQNEFLENQNKFFERQNMFFESQTKMKRGIVDILIFGFKGMHASNPDLNQALDNIHQNIHEGEQKEGGS